MLSLGVEYSRELCPVGVESSRGVMFSRGYVQEVWSQVFHVIFYII